MRKMEKATKRKIIKYAIHSAKEALVAMLIFWVIYEGRHIEIVRSLAGDSAFTWFNSLVFSGMKSNDPYDTKVTVLKVDAKYLKSKGLWDENNESTYGYIFPRSKIASFIEKIDTYPKEKQPLALFIDFDMEYGTVPFDSNESLMGISEDDKVLLESLAKNRSYTIVFPKTAHHNLIEMYATTAKTDKVAREIADKIAKGKILFANVRFLSSDHTVYRYNPLDVYDGKIYYHTALVLWSLRKSGRLLTDELEKIYPKEIFGNKTKISKYGAALIESNVLYKDRYMISSEQEELTEWDGLRGYSLYDLVEQQNTIEMAPDTIVMIGMVDGENDMHTIPTDFQKSPGVWLHAQALKTTLFLNGKLELINKYMGFLIVFIVFFLVTLTTRVFLENIGAFIRFMVELLLLVGVLLLISSYLLVEFKQWFNWFVPILIYYADDFFMYIRARWTEQIN